MAEIQSKTNKIVIQGKEAQFSYNENGDIIKELYIPEGIEVLEAKDLIGLESQDIERLILPTSLKSITSETFANFTKLYNIVFNEGLETIGDEAFYDCTGLKNIVLPSSLKEIGEYAFSSLNLETVVINGCEEMGDYAFASNFSLKKVEIKNCETIGYKAFAECNNLIEVVLPNNVTCIRVGAFEYCKNLTKINLPKSLEIVEDAAFENVPAEFDIPATLKTISTCAFAGCNGIKGTLRFEPTLQCLDNDAFYGVKNLEKLVLPAKIICDIGELMSLQCKFRDNFTVELYNPKPDPDEEDK